jgi:small subunit ribosomal protein S4
MARYCGAVCRLCRREGEKLFLKGERCYTSKCAMERRQGGPGQHGRGRQAFSGFKIQLRAKQKAKRMYGLTEQAFRRCYIEAAQRRGVTGTEMLVSLERRLDNCVFRLGFGISRAQARQLVSHGHILVNGSRVTIPSYAVSVGDVLEVVEAKRGSVSVKASVEASASRPSPGWLSLDRESLKGSVLSLPTREQIPASINEQLVVELYSR